MKCVICGKEIEKSRYGNNILCSSVCWNINYWNEVLADPNTLIIDNVAYIDDGRKPKDYRGFLGFGGREFAIETNDGRTISTNNLWCRGDIPLERHAQDNAKFVR